MPHAGPAAREQHTDQWPELSADCCSAARREEKERREKGEEREGGRMEADREV